MVSLHGDSENDEKEFDIPDSSPTPEERVERTQLQQEVWQALGELKKEYKDIIVYFDMQGLSYEEVAAVIGIPVGTVKSRLNRARSALKKILYQKREQI